MENNLFLSGNKTFRKQRKKKYLSISKKKGKLIPTLTLQDIQKNLIFSLSKSPETALKESRNRKIKDFHSYIQKLDNSMTKYQLTYVPPRGLLKEEKKGPNERFMDSNDKKLIKKMYDFNKTIFNKGLASVNEDSNMRINIDQREYPNPYQSLGVIKHNYHIYNEVSKDFLFRQTDLFKEQIKNIQKHQSVLKTKMPNLVVSGSTNKENYDIPVVDLTEERDKKEEINSVTILPHTGGSLRLFSYYRYPNKNFPEGKEQFSMFLKDKEIIICGGLSAFMKGMSIWSLNLEQLEWVKTPQKSPTNNRFGHTSVIYQNKIFLFGGRTKYGGGFVSPGLEIFSLTENAFTNQDPEGNIFPEPRKNHIAELIGSQMIIHGGLNESNEILNDCYFLNLNQLKWGVCTINRSTPSPRLYGHTSCLVLPKEYYQSHRLSIYSYPEMETGSNRLKEKGIYIFGGKTKEEGGLSNKIWILLIGQRQLKWISPEIKGKPPSPRYFHSMNYYDKGNMLIIHGGRNDAVSDSCALDDTFIFDLENFEWMGVTLYSQLNNFKVLHRCAHKSVVYSNKLIILGGMNNNNYIGSALLIVNLDFSYSNNRKSVEELLIKELESKNDFESRKKLIKIKNDLKKNQLGVVTNITLPEIK
jgi:hypothetical protein